MARHKSDPATTNQLDMFGTLSPELANQNANSVADVTRATEPAAANDVDAVGVASNEPDVFHAPAPETDGSILIEPPDPPSPPRPAAIVTSTTVWVDDEWWTLAMVCTYLKLGRKAVWARKRDPKLGFPQPVCLGSSRPRWRGGEVRGWASSRR